MCDRNILCLVKLLNAWPINLIPDYPSRVSILYRLLGSASNVNDNVWKYLYHKNYRPSHAIDALTRRQKGCNEVLYADYRVVQRIYLILDWTRVSAKLVSATLRCCIVCMVTEGLMNDTIMHVSLVQNTILAE